MMQLFEKDFDVVVHALTEYRDKLWKMTESNMNRNVFNMLDDIRLKQIEELDAAIKERKTKCQ